jgi:hypothetical protein
MVGFRCGGVHVAQDWQSITGMLCRRNFINSVEIHTNMQCYSVLQGFVESLIIVVDFGAGSSRSASADRDIAYQAYEIWQHIRLTGQSSRGRFVDEQRYQRSISDTCLSSSRIS